MGTYYDEPAGAAMPATSEAARQPMADAMPYSTPAHASAIPTADPIPMQPVQMQPMMIHVTVPSSQQACAVDCMSITSMVIGIISLILVPISMILGNWVSVIFGLAYGMMIVTATSFWSCACCGNKRQRGRTSQRLLMAASALMILAIIANFVMIYAVVRCQDSKVYLACGTFALFVNSSNFLCVGLVLATAFMIRQQLNEWDMMSAEARA